MQIDKQSAARRLIDVAIRNHALGEDPIANHVIVMSCFDLLREYAGAKGKTFRSITDIVRPEYEKEVVKRYLKRGWYFLKHARDDSDQLFDCANIGEINRSLTILNISKYFNVFGQESDHMRFFCAVETVVNPRMFKQEFVGRVNTAALQIFGAVPPVLTRELLRDVYVEWVHRPR